MSKFLKYLLFWEETIIKPLASHVTDVQLLSMGRAPVTTASSLGKTARNPFSHMHSAWLSGLTGWGGTDAVMC